jgi:hypothetical protein
MIDDAGSRNPADAAGGRARRYAVNAPCWYRPVRAAAWRCGTAVDISPSGVLIETDQNLPLDVLLEVRIGVAPPVYGLAFVVRGSGAGGRYLVGARFETVRFFEFGP